MKEIELNEDLNDNFYKWFDGSKVTENGKPLIVYHASDAEFDTFDINYFGYNDEGWFGTGFYFTNDYKQASNYAENKPKAYYLSIKNPLYIKSESMNHKDIDEYKLKLMGETDMNKINNISWLCDAFDKFLRDNKYDGVIFEWIGHDYKEYVALKPNQIKSVDNKGTWSDSENIYEKFNEAVAEITEETLPELNDNFWRWFGDSVVKDKEGNPLICFHGSTLDIDEFDTEYSGKNTGNNEEKVFYFTTDREMAVSYSTEAVIRQKEIPYYDKEEGTEYETWEEFEEYLRTEVCKTPHINPCFICMEKPYIYDAGFRDFDPKLNYTLMSMIKGEIDTSHWLFDENLYYDIANEHEEYDEETDEYIQIKDFDYDGIIIRNVRDSISPLVDKYCDEYIVWNPTQIKSIYNKGNWSWNSRNVFETLNREIERYL